ncbi:MAG: acyl-CoA dehydrogenase family protein [Promethearchaeota archaeon]
MFLLNPRDYQHQFSDKHSTEIMLKTIDYFEKRGLQKLKEDDHNRTFYEDFIEFQKKERIFSTLLTPPQYGGKDTRWDMWRNYAFNEILAFYGLAYWYTWQVSILGLGPIWMSNNENLKQQAAQHLKDGAVFAFGLSEKKHGADIYSTEMSLTPQPDGTFLANGAKYYIGNANTAPMVSTFGKMTDANEYVFFVADYRNQNYELVKNVCNSQNFVAEFGLHNYKITQNEILSQGQEAWDAALNTVNVGKYNLGVASIGICTHAFYEALNHAANRQLYGMQVTDFPHVKQMFIDAYSRLIAMKLFALRAVDYMRIASPEDRRYLLYNTMVKMKVTLQGEEVINLLWNVIAAKGFEKDTYFEMAARDIRALPKLEGTVHVNLALVAKFIFNYFFNHKEYPLVSRQDQSEHDAFLFEQGPTRGLGKIQFHDYNLIFEEFELPNVKTFKKQIEIFKEMLSIATPSQEQQRDTDFSMAITELFALIVYAQLILENARIYEIDSNEIEQVFDFMIRDFSKYALQLYSKSSTTQQQSECCMKMIQKPLSDPDRFQQSWENVMKHKDLYEMSP